MLRLVHNMTQDAALRCTQQTQHKIEIDPILTFATQFNASATEGVHKLKRNATQRLASYCEPGLRLYMHACMHRWRLGTALVRPGTASSALWLLRTRSARLSAWGSISALSRRSLGIAGFSPKSGRAVFCCSTLCYMLYYPLIECIEC